MRPLLSLVKCIAWGLNSATRLKSWQPYSSLLAHEPHLIEHTARVIWEREPMSNVAMTDHHHPDLTFTDVVHSGFPLPYEFRTLRARTWNHGGFTMLSTSDYSDVGAKIDADRLDAADRTARESCATPRRGTASH